MESCYVTYNNYYITCQHIL